MAIWGVGLGTAYLVWLYYRVVMGETNSGLKSLELELNPREVATLCRWPSLPCSSVLS